MKGKLLVVFDTTLITLTVLIGLTQAQAGSPQSSATSQIGVGTAFTYQGQLKKDGNPINSTCDFRFILYTADIGGSQVGPIQDKTGVSVTNGLFAVSLDFGSGAFTGDARWLDIAVRCPAGSGTHSPLTPRQALAPAPYALALPGLWTQQNDTSPNLIGGRFNNTVTVGVYGATIGGGGAASDISTGDPVPNRVTDSYGTVGGGVGNQAGNATGPLTDTMFATVGGGRVNIASGWESVVAGGAWNTASGPYATVAGGTGNTASFTKTTVCGGINNIASGENATVGGGIGNTANGEDATVGGGRGNTASYGATVAGGGGNVASGQHASIGGGDGNTASGDIGVIGGGKLNSASDGTGITVGGGYSNTAHGDFAIIGGGEENFTSGPLAFVGGGYQNVASQAAAVGGGTNNMAVGGKSFIGGGGGNYASGDHAVIGGGANNAADGYRATVLGGDSNTASGDIATIGGGDHNTASGNQATIAGGISNTVNGYGAFVGGGVNNTASAGLAVVAGGNDNTASGWDATVPGGMLNTAQGNNSFAAGMGAKANHNGAFVWGDWNAADINSSGDNQFIVRAHGGVWFGQATGDFTPTIGANVFISTSTGGYLSTGGMWTNASGRNAKENFAAVNGREVLARLAEIPVTTWNYSAQDASIRHMGPVAQDFSAAFGLGEDDTHIGTVDADGVALAAIQGLNQIVQEQDAQITALQQRTSDLEARLSTLEQRPDSGSNDSWPYGLTIGALIVGFAINQRRKAGGRS